MNISEDRMHHILAVARKCYKVAKDMELPEDFCKRMFMIGYLHDVGYEFAEDKNKHNDVGESLLKVIGLNNATKENQKVLHAIRKHGKPTRTKSLEWRILNIADMTVDSKGNNVMPNKRLDDIANRYGVESEEYKMAKKIMQQVGLIP